MAKKNTKTTKKTKTLVKACECKCNCKSLYQKVKSFVDSAVNKIKSLL